MKVEWNAKPFLKEVEKVSDDSTKEIAMRVREKAQQHLDRKTDGTGALAGSIYVYESKYKDGGHIVYAHGDEDYVNKMGKLGRYYAVFVEFGTNKRRAKPYLKPALRSEGKHLLKAFRKHYKKRIESTHMRGDRY